MKGVYKYQYLAATRPTRVMKEDSVNVEVLAHTETQYKVKYLGFHANGAPVGHITFVRKDRVLVDHAEAERTLPRVGKPVKPKKKPVKIPTWRPYNDD